MNVANNSGSLSTVVLALLLIMLVALAVWFVGRESDAEQANKTSIEITLPG
jgi:cytochrome oxidase assembly protein ShyY1